jgi:VCBS repeat-containing protein
LNFVGKFDAQLPSDGSIAHSHVHVEHPSAHAPADAIIIPDAHLLFGADFKRSGVDLILSNSDRELVVHDYFKGEHRLPLASPDGAHLTGDLVNALTGQVEYAQAGAPDAVAHVIGHVTKLSGSATAIRNGVSIILNQGDNVEKGDVVATGSDSTLGVTFLDGTVFGLSSNARMVLNEMVYDPNGSNNSSLISLVAGTISFVAGETAKHGDMKVDTPVATMGIRGTAVLVEIDFNVPGANGLPDAKFQVLVEPDGTTGSYILFDKTTLDPIATVNRAGQQVNINQNGISYSNSPLTPELQKLITDVFTQKFSNTDTNTKLVEHFTDSIVPDAFHSFKGPDGIVIQAVFIQTNTLGNGPGQVQGAIPTHPRVNLAPTVFTSNDGFTELHNVSGSHTPDVAHGTIKFADVNEGDQPTASAAFTSFSYQNAQHHEISQNLTPTEQAAVQAVEVALNIVQDPAGINLGTATWTYSVPDGALDFLGAGETLTLTYLVTVSNNFAQSNLTTTVPITITITGTNDLPTIAASSGEILRSSGASSAASDTISGTIKFTDVDLTDRPVGSATFSSAKILDAQNHDVTSTLTAAQLAALHAVEVPLAIQQAGDNSNDGSATWIYSVADQAFSFLAPGGTLILDYLAEVNDGHGGVATQPIVVTLTEPLLGTAVLMAGVNTNSLGLPTETFANLSPGSISNNGAGSGNFYSVALDAMFSGTGNAGIVNGSSGVSAAPFIGPLPGQADTGNYLSVGAGGSETIAFTQEKDAFGLYWGSVDPYNTLAFYNGSVLVASYTGSDILPLLSDGSSNSFQGNGYVEFAHLPQFTEVVFGSGSNAFEVTNISSGNVELPVTEIASGASLVVTSSDTTTGITFEGTGGTLTISSAALDPSLNFEPTITGLNASDAIDFQQTVTSAFYNSGVLTLLDGSNPVAYLHLAGDYSNDAFVVTMIGTDVSQIVDPPAMHATIASGAVLELNTSSSENISFAGTAGTLLLDQPTGFHGQIGGLSGPGNVLDLAGLGVIDTALSATFNPQNDTTVVAVTNFQNHQSVELTLDGNYSSASLNATSDGAGGIEIYESPASVTVASGTALQIANASAENVAFQSSTGSLTLDNPSSFSGVISGFTGNGTLVGSDQIDLKGIDEHSKSFTESYDAASDSLTVGAGAVSAVLHFVGSYQAVNFSFASDNDGGTIVYDPPVAGGADPIVGTIMQHTATATDQGFVFNFGETNHVTAGSIPAAGDTHLLDALTAVNAKEILTGIGDYDHQVVAPEGHDAVTAILKSLFHAADFHFV